MVLLNEKNDVRGAVRHAERAASIRPEDPSAHFTLGEAYRRLGDLTKAADELETVVRLAPGTSGGTQALRSLLAIREARGETADAIRAYEKLLEWRPKDVGAMIDYSRLLVREGKADDAQAILQRARGIAPGNSRVEEELRRISVPDLPR
jgi:Flp pilus assembly protein TadD